MGDIDIETARALCDAATPGPWMAWDRGVGYEVHAFPGEGNRYEVFGYVHEDCANLDDAVFVAAARTLVPDLLDALAASEARTRELEATVQRVAELHKVAPQWLHGTDECPDEDRCDLCGESWPCDTFTALRGSDV